MPRRSKSSRRRAKDLMVACSSSLEKLKIIRRLPLTRFPVSSSVDQGLRFSQRLSPTTTLCWLFTWAERTFRTRKVKIWPVLSWQTRRFASLSSKVTASVSWQPRRSLLHFARIELSAILTWSRTISVTKERRTKVLKTWFKLSLRTPLCWVWTLPTTSLMSRLAVNSWTCLIRTAKTREPSSTLNSVSTSSVLKM